MHIHLEQAVGASDVRNIWKREEEWLNRIYEGKRGALRTKRLHDLRQTSSGLLDNTFWQSESDGHGNLRLRSGFAFAGPKFQAGRASGSDLFFIISRILQHARESKSLSPEHSLQSDELQQVVIAPITFSRFDDGIIQASILRAALDSELDYRDDELMSQEMADLIFAIVGGKGKLVSEASTEFLVALGTGRLKLQKRLQEGLLDSLRKIKYLRRHTRTLILHLQGNR